jgi:hypothetical protein
MQHDTNREQFETTIDNTGSVDSLIINQSKCPTPDCGKNANIDALQRIVDKIRATGPYIHELPMQYSGSDMTSDVITALAEDPWFHDDGFTEVKDVTDLAKYLRVPEGTARYTFKSITGCFFYAGAVADYIENKVLPAAREQRSLS